MSRFLTIAFSLTLALKAFGGTGQGGGGAVSFSNTLLLLQSHPYEETFLSFEGGTSIPEGSSTPEIGIPKEEYDNFLGKIEPGAEESACTSFILEPVTGNDGVARSYQLCYWGDPTKEPLYLYLKLVK